MKPIVRWILGLSIFLSISACIAVLAMQRLEIGRLADQNAWLLKERAVYEKRLELAGLSAERAAGEPSDLGDEESAPVATDASETREKAKEKAAEQAGRRLAAEVERLRRELEAYRNLPGETVALLAIARDPARDRSERQAVLSGLLAQCDIGTHVQEILDAFADEADPEMRRNFAGVLADLAVKFHSAEMVGAVMDDLREGSGNADSAASMLARFHGPGGVDGIGAYLTDENEHVRRAAIQAIGQKLPKSEAVVSALRAAEMSPDQRVRGRAAFYLANHDEPFSYEGMIDDWRALTFSMAADDFGSISTPAEKIFSRLSPEEIAGVLGLVADLGQSHPDENIRNFMKNALTQLQQNGVGNR